MKKWTLVLACTFVVALLAHMVVAAAGDEEPRDPQRRVRRGGPGGGPGRDGRRPGRREGRGERQRRMGGPRPRFGPVMRALDTDGDGELSAEEIANAPAALKTLDKNGDGKLTRDELRPSVEDREAEFVKRIMAHDKDGDGKVTKDELPEWMQRMMERCDTNEDGVIDQAEAEAMAKRMSQRGPGMRPGRRGGEGGPGEGRGRGGPDGEGRRRSRARQPEAE